MWWVCGVCFCRSCSLSSFCVERDCARTLRCAASGSASWHPRPLASGHHNTTSTSPTAPRITSSDMIEVFRTPSDKNLAVLSCVWCCTRVRGKAAGSKGKLRQARGKGYILFQSFPVTNQLNVSDSICPKKLTTMHNRVSTRVARLSMIPNHEQQSDDFKQMTASLTTSQTQNRYVRFSIGRFSKSSNLFALLATAPHHHVGT